MGVQQRLAADLGFTQLLLQKIALVAVRSEHLLQFEFGEIQEIATARQRAQAHTHRDTFRPHLVHNNHDIAPKTRPTMRPLPVSCAFQVKKHSALEAAVLKGLLICGPLG
eukprot:scaffold59381_cov19-Tisochrysis_lutea.AAC.1